MLYFLFESSLGFSLFKVNEWDKISTTSPKLLKDFDTFESFKKVASLEANQMFQGHNVAFETLSKVNSGELPAELSDFLKANLPSVKKQNVQLVVQDKNLATKINEELKLKCVSGEAYTDIFRSVRKHLGQFLIGETENVSQGRITSANLGIGHSFARHNIQFDEKRQDKAIINSFSLLDTMEKNLNTFSMRLKESYGWHFPELAKLVSDSESYARLVALVGVI